MKVLNSSKTRVEHNGDCIDTEYSLIVTLGRYLVIMTRITNGGLVEVVLTHEHSLCDEAYTEYRHLCKHHSVTNT